MLWIILTIVLLLCAVGAWLWSSGGAIDSEEKTLSRVVAIAILAIWVIVSVIMSVKPVDAGEVGIVRQFGSIVGQVDEGVNFVAPWRSIDPVSIRTERFKFENLTAASSETQDVFVTLTINYSVSEDAVQDLIRNVGTNWFDVLIPSRVNNFLKAETAKWITSEIIPNREVIRRAVQTRLQEDMTQYSITISDLLIDNISFSEEYLQAIEEKQVATERAQAAQNRVAETEAEADQTRAEARGDADAVVIAAQGQAEANELIAESLSLELIQWQAIQRLSDDVEIIMVPSDQGLILDVGSLAPTATAPE